MELVVGHIRPACTLTIQSGGRAGSRLHPGPALGKNAIENQTPVYFCLPHEFDNFLSIFGHFCCFVGYFLIFLQFLSGVQMYVWKDVIHTVVLAIKNYQTFLFLDKFVKENIFLLL